MPTKPLTLPHLAAALALSACAPTDDTAGAAVPAAALTVDVFEGPADLIEHGSGYALFMLRGEPIAVHGCGPTPGADTMTCTPYGYTVDGPTLRAEGRPQPTYRVVWAVAPE